MKLAKTGWFNTTPVPESRPPIPFPVGKTDKDIRYIPLRDKKASVKFKDYEGYTLEELNGEDSDVAMLIPDGIVVIDFDTAIEAEIIQRILKDKGITTRILKTKRGIHTYWQISKPWKNNNGQQLRCGLNADIKSYGVNGYAIVRDNGIDRELINDMPLFSVPACPSWLYPAPKTARPILGMKEGENGGRNGALSYLTMALQPLGVPKEDIIETVNIANQYVLGDPLPQSDIDTILRDESFGTMDVYRDENGELPWFLYNDKGKETKFLHDVFGDYLIERRNIITINDLVYVYDQGYYRQAWNVLEAEMLVMYKGSTRRERAEVLDYIRIKTTVDDPETIHQDEFIINIENGRFDIRTGELHPHTADAYDFHRVPVTFDPMAESEVLDETLETVMDSDPERIALLEEAIGYCFMRSCKFRKGFMLTGTGRNGKSTIVEMIKQLVGKRNTVTIEMDKLGDKFKTAELENRLLNVSDDTAYTAIGDTGTLKKLFTGEGVTVERKNERPFTLENRAKLFITANKIPRILDTTEGMYSRLAIIPFEHVFEDTDDNNDKDILQKLTTPQAKSRLFNRAISGVQRLIRNNKFTTSSKVEQAMKDFKESQKSPIELWIDDECITKEILMSEPISDIYQKFIVWGNNTRVKIDNIPQPTFTLTINKMYGTESKPKRIGDKTIRYFE